MKDAEGAAAWHGGFVLGGLVPADIVWWNALRKPLAMGLRLGRRITAAWVVVHVIGALSLVLACQAGGIVHKVRNLGGDLQA